MALTWSTSDAWAASTPYALLVRVYTAAGNVYQCVQAGTSGLAAPTGTGTGITDGTVKWDYLGAYTGSVTDYAPDLASGTPVITPAAQGVFLNLADKLVSDLDVWQARVRGDLIDPGRAYLAAHFGQLSRLRGHGPVTSEAVGPLSRGYASLVGPFAVDLTPAGRQYMDLVRTTTAIFGVLA